MKKVWMGLTLALAAVAVWAFIRAGVILAVITAVGSIAVGALSITRRKKVGHSSNLTRSSRS